MTKKVTGNDLKKLLEAALNEKNYTKTGINNSLWKKSQLDPNEFKALADFDKVDTTISSDDFKDTIQNYTQASHAKEKAALDKILSGILANDSGDKLKSDLVKLSADIPSFDITSKKFDQKTTPDSVFQFDLRNAEMSEATPQLTPALTNIFEALSLANKTLPGRIQLINEFSNNLMQASNNNNAATTKLNTLGLLEFTQYALVVDYLSTICRQIDSGSGAYMFEVFLGMLAGGTVTGKVTTSGGKMGGADLTFGGTDLASGSSKFLKPTSKATQSMSGFEKQGEFVHYIIAKKNLQGKKASSADVKSLLGLDIHYVVVYVKTAKKKLDIFTMDASGKPVQYGGTQTGGTLNLPIDEKSLIGTLNLVDDRNNEYRDILEGGLNNLGGTLKQGFAKLQAAMDDSVRVKESLGDYTTSGANANTAADNFIAFRKTFKDVMTNLSAIDPKYKSASASKVAQLEEQKITSNSLKKLIEESFKK